MLSGPCCRFLLLARDFSRRILNARGSLAGDVTNNTRKVKETLLFLITERHLKVSTFFLVRLTSVTEERSATSAMEMSVAIRLAMKPIKRPNNSPDLSRQSVDVSENRTDTLDDEIE